MFLLYYVITEIRNSVKIINNKEVRMEENKIVTRLEELEKRILALEGKDKEDAVKVGYKDLTDPKNLENGRFIYAGNYKTKDGRTGSIFGSNVSTIDEILQYDSTELANIIDAFSSVERIEIIKQLMKQSYTAKDLMEILNFSTTGKIYHHLSYLEKVGVIAKYNDIYHISAKFMGSIILIFEGAGKLINRIN